MLYNSEKKTVTDESTGETRKFYCGDEIDKLGVIMCKLAFKPENLQKAYHDMVRLFNGEL